KSITRNISIYKQQKKKEATSLLIIARHPLLFTCPRYKDINRKSTQFDLGISAYLTPLQIIPC
ncbi:hypothetical protein OFN50_38240, partial [Escherichia coli]|nr:hypothetical protein [Escherichia coli]